MPSRAEARRRTLLSFATFSWKPLVRDVQRAAEGRISDVADAPARDVALVLGAPVQAGQVTAVLEDRVLTSLALFQAGKAKRLLLSGTPLEVEAMAALLGSRVPEPAILRDPRGLHTFESTRNAAAMGLRELLVVSQAFHLPRALFLARKLGLDAHGVRADRRPYQHQQRFERREQISCVLAWWMAK